MNNLSDYVYMSYGNKMNFYTLRRRYSFETYITVDFKPVKVIRENDYHIKNLSTDYVEGLEKLTKYANDNGYQFKSPEKLPKTLDEIRRRSEEELEAERKRLREARAEAEYEAEMAFNSRHEGYMNLIDAGYMPFGKYKSRKMEALDDDYVLYFLRLEIDETARPQEIETMILLRNKLKEIFPHLANLPTPNGKHFMNEKDKFEANVTLVGAFGFEGYYGFTWVLKFVTDTGECLVYKGSKAYPDIKLGKPVTIKGTVKEHTHYKGENQTSIIRFKVI